MEYQKHPSTCFLASPAHIVARPRFLSTVCGILWAPISSFVSSFSPFIPLILYTVKLTFFCRIDKLSTLIYHIHLVVGSESTMQIDRVRRSRAKMAWSSLDISFPIILACVIGPRLSGHPSACTCGITTAILPFSRTDHPLSNTSGPFSILQVSRSRDIRRIPQDEKPPFTIMVDLGKSGVCRSGNQLLLRAG